MSRTLLFAASFAMKKFTSNNQEFILRDLCPADTDLYLEFFNELSEESIRCRFGHLLAKLTKASAEQRTTIAEGERAIAIFDNQQTKIVAIGRCYLNTKSNEAEVALVVADSVRRLGLGRILLGELVDIAKEENSESISAFIATENAPVIKLLQSIGFVVQPKKVEGDLHLTLVVESGRKIAAH